VKTADPLPWPPPPQLIADDRVVVRVEAVGLLRDHVDVGVGERLGRRCQHAQPDRDRRRDATPLCGPAHTALVDAEGVGLRWGQGLGEGSRDVAGGAADQHEHALGRTEHLDGRPDRAWLVRIPILGLPRAGDAGRHRLVVNRQLLADHREHLQLVGASSNLRVGLARLWRAAIHAPRGQLVIASALNGDRLLDRATQLVDLVGQPGQLYRPQLHAQRMALAEPADVAHGR
jgi:hypothetical protein